MTKVLILAGGYGTRLSEETQLIPKPMVEIGGKPIIWHIMKIYSHYGFNDFIILCGYKGYLIKEYFANYFLHHADISINLVDNSIQFHNNQSEPWKITLLDTGKDTNTGGRILKAKPHISKGSRFMLTYGDGLGNININDLLYFHKKHGKIITMTSALPEGRFGALDIEEKGRVNRFVEKPKGDGTWINAGFFVCEYQAFDYIEQGDETIWERDPMEKLANEGNLYAFKHEEFWRPMDTLRDKISLEKMWNTGQAKWKLW